MANGCKYVWSWLHNFPWSYHKYEEWITTDPSFAFKFVVTVWKRDDWNICDKISDNLLTDNEKKKRSSGFLSLMVLTKAFTAGIFEFPSQNNWHAEKPPKLAVTISAGYSISSFWANSSKF